MQPSHNNGTKIGMGKDQSYEPHLPASKASLVVVWLLIPPDSPSSSAFSSSSVSSRPQIFSRLFVRLSCGLKPGRLKGSHPMILTNLSVSVIAP